MGEVFSDTINTGIYVLEPEVLQYMSREGLRLLEGHLPADAARREATRRLRHDGLLDGHRQPRAVSSGELDALEGRVRFECAGTELSPGVWPAKDCRIASDARICARDSWATVDRSGPTSRASDRRWAIRGSSQSGALDRAHRALERRLHRRSRQASGCTIADANDRKDHVTMAEGSVIGSGCVIGSGASSARTSSYGPRRRSRPARSSRCR